MVGKPCPIANFQVDKVVRWFRLNKSAGQTLSDIAAALLSKSVHLLAKSKVLLGEAC